MMEEKSLHIVIVGHVDHGKSTLVGRLFYDTGSLPPEKLDEIKKASTLQGKDVEFAFMMDNLEEERKRGITIDIAHTFFSTEKRRYVIIDAPGHKEFLKNMISGVSQAEAAILLVDISQGIREQTLRHCYILGLLGVRQVAVLVNKMDLAGYSEEAFRSIENEISSVLGRLNISPAYVIPISAIKGENVAKKTENLSWYQGPTVLQALDSFRALKVEEKGLRFPVQDMYDLDGGEIAVGRVEAGVLRKGQDVFILPGKAAARVLEIRKFLEDGLTEAQATECIGIRVEGDGLKRGDIIVDAVTSTITDSVRANIFWMVDKDYKLGVPLTFKCATQEVKGRIEKIYRRFDPASVEIVENDASTIKPAEVAEVEIRLDRPVAVDSFSDIPETGRFVLEHAGYPVAGGIII
ncbi:MAG: 50S ribosome-binding GTPase [Deltaproteobacteria bacterium]|nr:50S ribosome-binding GTPase [Deltaproteobacteria bacterium]